tara:strand:- start:467 stop:1120 length:654 start_codon:yes stop_codon:yes gene_type:complete
LESVSEPSIFKNSSKLNKADQIMTDETSETDADVLARMMIPQPLTLGQNTSGSGGMIQLRRRGAPSSSSNSLINTYLPTAEVSTLVKQKQTLALTLLAIYTGDVETYARGDPKTKEKIIHMAQQLQLAFEQGIISFVSAGNIYAQELDLLRPQRFINIVRSFNGNPRHLAELANKIHAALDAARWCTKTGKAMDLDGFKIFLAFQTRQIARENLALP